MFQNGVEIAFHEFDKSHFEKSSTEIYENFSLGPKINFEIHSFKVSVLRYIHS